MIGYEAATALTAFQKAIGTKFIERRGECAPVYPEDGSELSLCGQAGVGSPLTGLDFITDERINLPVQWQWSVCVGFPVNDQMDAPPLPSIPNWLV